MLAGLLVAESSVVTPTVVANSYGCQVVIELARCRPELVGSIILISPTVDLPRILALSAAIHLTWQLGQPSRALSAYGY